MSNSRSPLLEKIPTSTTQFLKRSAYLYINSKHIYVILHYIYDNVIYNNMYVRLSKFPVKLYMNVCFVFSVTLYDFMTLNMIPTAL